MEKSFCELGLSEDSSDGANSSIKKLVKWTSKSFFSLERPYQENEK
jgi:hypothetical protein